jgi:hypothetical protein
MKKSLDDMQYDFGKIFVTAGMAPVLLSPFLLNHPFESTWTFFVSSAALIVGILVLRASMK